VRCGRALLPTSAFFFPRLTDLSLCRFKAFQDVLRNRVKCKCPDVQESEFQRLYVPSFDYLFNMLKGRNADLSGTCDKSSFINSTMVPFRYNVTSASYYAVNPTEFVFPSTCNADSWNSQGTCLMRWTPASNLQFEAQLALKKCPNSPVPAISLTCKGQACDTAFMPCDDATACGTGMKCTTFKQTTYPNGVNSTSVLSDVPSNNDFVKFLYDVSITTTPSGAACINPANMMGSLYNFVRKQYDGMSVQPKTELKICLPNPVPTGGESNPVSAEALLGTDSGCAITQTVRCDDPYTCDRYNASSGYSEPTICQYCRNDTSKIDCVNTGTPSLQTWNGQLDDGTSALSSARFPTLTVRAPAPLTAGASVLFYADCKHNMYVLPSSPVMPLFLSFNGLPAAYNEIWNFIKTGSDCAAPLPDQAFRIAKGVALDNLLYYLTTPQTTTVTSFGNHRAWALGGSNTGRLRMPTTCTYDHWNTNGWCGLKYTGLSGLFGAEMNIQARARKCQGTASGPYSQPEVFVECSGPGCQLLTGIKSCTATSDCATGLMCQELSTFWDALNITSDAFADIYWPRIYNNGYSVQIDNYTSIYNPGYYSENPAAGTCRSVQNQYTDLRRLVLAATGNDALTTNSKVCMNDVNHFKSVYSTWGNGEATVNADVTTMPNLFAWDAPQTNVLSYTPVPAAVLTVTVSGTTAPTAQQLADIAARIAALFGIDPSLVKVTVEGKKRATYTLVANIYAPQAQSQVQSANAAGTLTSSLNSAVSAATGNSLTVTATQATIPTPGAATDDGNGSGAVSTAPNNTPKSAASSVQIGAVALVFSALIALLL
jgi:hypothetical protein